MTCWIGVPARPPYSFGHVIPASPASALRRWRSLARWSPSASPYRDSHVSNEPCLSVAFFSKNARTSSRNVASSGVSLKSIVLSSGGLRVEAGDQEILPAAGAAERETQELRA